MCKKTIRPVFEIVKTPNDDHICKIEVKQEETRSGLKLKGCELK